jgi:hypothetical protein
MKRLTRGGGRQHVVDVSTIPQPTPPTRSLKDINPVQYKILKDQYKEQRNEYINQVVQEELDNAESLLTMSGQNLIQMAKAAGLDPNKSAKELQTALYTSAVENATAKLPPQNHGYTNAEIIRLKQQFLDSMQSTPFILTNANLLNISERLVQSWIRTDPEFAARIYESQKRLSENVAAGLLKAGLSDGDTAALMFLAKQYGTAFNEALLRNFNGGETVEDTEGVPSIENLAPDEQLMLLNLIRKSKNPQATAAITEYVPTNFIESDDDSIDSTD